MKCQLALRLAAQADRLDEADERVFLKCGTCITLKRCDLDELIRVLREACDALNAYSQLESIDG